MRDFGAIFDTFVHTLEAAKLLITFTKEHDTKSRSIINIGLGFQSELIRKAFFWKQFESLSKYLVLLEKSVTDHYYNYLIPKYETKKKTKEPQPKASGDDYYQEQYQE